MLKIYYFIAFIVFILIFNISAQTENLGDLNDFQDINNDGILTLDEIKIYSNINFDNKSENTKKDSKDLLPLFWTQITYGGPSTVENPALAYDSTRKTSVLFGGHYYNSIDGDIYVNQTFELYLGYWQQKVTELSPEPRQDHGMAYDPERKIVVLFGGRFAKTHYNDTWVYNGTNWTKILTSASPSPRINFFMAYNPQIKKVILFGGRNANTSLFGECYNDTWAFNGENWEKLSPQSSPTPRAYPMGDTDTFFNNTMLFGGLYEWNNTIQFYQDMWFFDGYNWIQKYVGSILPINQFDDLKYDPHRKVFVGFGCSSSPLGNNETWEYKSGTWYKRYPMNSPTSRLNSRLCYNETNGGIILFGGYKNENLQSFYLNDTYVLNGPVYSDEDFWTFELSNENWAFYSPNSLIQGGWEPGHLFFNIKGNTDAFGFWGSPVTTLDNTKLYRARYIISTDIADRSKFPVIRLRCNSADFTYATYTAITSIGIGELSPQQNIMTPYDMYFVPPFTAAKYGAIFSMDLLNIDPNDASSGKINIEEVQLESVAIPAFSK